MLDIDKGQTWQGYPNDGAAEAHIAVLHSCCHSAGRRWNAPSWRRRAQEDMAAYTAARAANSPFVQTVKEAQAQFKWGFRRSVKYALKAYLRFHGGITVRKRFDDGTIGEHHFREDEVWRYVELKVEAPDVVTSDPLAAAQVNQIELQNKTTSPQQVIAEKGRDYEQVMAEWDDFNERPTGGGGQGCRCRGRVAVVRLDPGAGAPARLRPLPAARQLQPDTPAGGSTASRISRLTRSCSRRCWVSQRSRCRLPNRSAGSTCRATWRSSWSDPMQAAFDKSGTLYLRVNKGEAAYRPLAVKAVRWLREGNGHGLPEPAMRPDGGPVAVDRRHTEAAAGEEGRRRPRARRQGAHGGQFVAQGGDESTSDKPAASKASGAAAVHPGAAHDFEVKVKAVKEMAAPRGENGKIKPVETKTVLTKQETGRVGEAAIRSYLKSIVGIKDTVALNAGKTNESIDLFGDSMAPEVKSGMCNVSEKAQRWRITFSMELGKAEQAKYDALTEEQQKAWREKRQRSCLKRKLALLKKLSEAGAPIKPVTYTAVVNPDTQTADIYLTEGYHQRIGWNDPKAKHVGSVRYDHAD